MKKNYIAPETEIVGGALRLMQSEGELNLSSIEMNGGTDQDDSFDWGGYGEDGDDAGAKGNLWDGWED